MKVKNSLSHSLRNLFDKNKDVRDFLPYAIAKRLAYLLPISDGLSDLQTYYSVNCYKEVITVISVVNEKIVFDTNEAIKTTYILWNTRCQLAFNPDAIDFLTLLESAKTGLISTTTINRLYEVKNKTGDRGSKAVNYLETIFLQEIVEDNDE